MTQTANTVTDRRDVGALAAAHVEPDAATEYAETPKPTEPVGPDDPEVAGGDDDPEESASEEDQPGHDSEPGINEPAPLRTED